MRVSAKVDYAIRAAAELAAAHGTRPLKRSDIAGAQAIPGKFLEAIMIELRHAGIVKSMRGPNGGHVLARPASQVSLADVIRAVDGPLAHVRGERAESVAYLGAAEGLRDVWIAVRASLSRVLESTTLEDVVRGQLPATVRNLAVAPDRWSVQQRRVTISPLGEGAPLQVAGELKPLASADVVGKA